MRSVVDCTGDADVCLYAGAPTALFGQGNVLAAWYYSLTQGDRESELHMLGYSDISDEEKKTTAAPPTLVRERFGGLDAQEISDMMQLSHTQILGDLRKRRADKPDYTLTTIATIPQLRMTRRIAGEFTLDTAHDHQEFDTSIGAIGNWRKRGPAYHIPFECLYSRRVPNLITAGRVISTTDAMWDIARVIPACAVTGEAAGAAAAMSDDFAALDVQSLRAYLAGKGVRF